MKRSISVLLILVLLVGIVPMFACAESSDVYKYELKSLMPNESYTCYNDADTDEGFKFYVNACYYGRDYDVFMDGYKIGHDTFDSYPDGWNIVYTLKQDYLNTVASGKHTLSVWYTDGYRAKAEITVQSVKDAPNTGDSANLIGWAAVMTLSLTAAAGLWVSLKKKEKI